MSDRIPCVIDGCRCSRKPDPAIGAWLCRRHYRMVDTGLRTRHQKMKRALRKIIRLSTKRATISPSVQRAIGRVRKFEADAWNAVVEDAQIKDRMGAE